MATTLTIQPDTQFLRGVIAAGGGNLKQCFQCATCTSVCSLSDESRPFPRKQMIEAQWGLKGQLMADPAVWLCHNCGDCTTKCPRDARPGQVMAAVRGEIIKQYAVPRFMGTLVSSPKALPLLFALPVVILMAIAVWPVHAGPIPGWEYGFMFPQSRLEPLFFAVSGLVVLAYAAGVIKFVHALRASGANGPILPALLPVLGEIAMHKRFSECGVEKSRYPGHLLVSYGFVGLAVVGTVIGIGTMVGVMHTPLPLWSPLKVFANLSAVAIFLGAMILVINRIKDREGGGGAYFDWFFLLLLGTVALTGILSEALRLAQSQAWMYPVYFVHLTLILVLFLYAPYSKFAHFLYRTVALAATWQGSTQLTTSQDSAAKETVAHTSSGAEVSPKEPS